MAVSAHFQSEITAVDATKSLAFVLNPGTHDEFEFSYSGSGNVYTITSGTELGCEYGAAQLLYDLGYRFYASNPEFWKRPASINMALTQAATTWWFPSSQMFLVYGHSWGGSKAAWRTTLNNQHAKWQTLVGLLTSPFPAGHRWGGIVTPNLAWLQANPQVVKNGLNGMPPIKPAAATYFDLTITGADYTNLVNICAAQLISEGVNTWKATHFDPADGDTNTSQNVFQFAKDVCTAVRAGTPAIGTHPARTGIAGARLGVYAYAGHRDPHSVDLEDKVYVQIALGFSTGTVATTYEELVAYHGDVAAFIALREYLSTEVWDAGYPLSAKNADGYFDRYDSFYNSGAIGANSECGANWLANFTMLPAYIHKCRTGVTLPFATLNAQIVEDIFDDDPAVLEYLNYIGNPGVGWDKWALRQCMDHINDMVDGWYKTYFEQVATIWEADMTLPAKTPVNDTYRTAISQMLKWATGVAPDDIMHSYAKIRQRANAALSDPYYKDLMFSAAPEPDWFANATAPTHEEFLTAYAAAQANTVRDADLDSTDLVLVTGITPRVAATAPATVFYTVGRSTYKYVGPGTVTIQRVNGGLSYPVGSPVSTVYGDGIHTIVLGLGEESSVSCVGGHLFLDSFPKIRKDPDQSGRMHWLYIPTRMTGAVNLESGSRLTIFDQTGRLDIIPTTMVGYISPATRGPGQIRIDNTNTRGDFFNNNCNRYISMNPTVALLPRPIAEEDFPARAAVSIAS
jgi:hypothetical protein